MKFGDKIRMLRPYDGGRYAVGEVYKVCPAPAEPDQGKVAPGIADDLCAEAADGGGPFAERVKPESAPDTADKVRDDQGDDEQEGDESTDTNEE